MGLYEGYLRMLQNNDTNILDYTSLGLTDGN